VSGTVALIALLAIPAADADQSDAEVLAAAETAFAEGVRHREEAAAARPHFARAVEHYEELRRRGANAPALYRNLGHAYLLVGDLPRAILSYRHGLEQTPWDRGLQDDLGVARGLVVYSGSGHFGRPPPLPLWRPPLSSGAWAVLAAVCYAFAWPCWTRWWMTRRSSFLAVGIAAFVTACATTIFGWVEAQRLQEVAAHPVVVIAADDVRLRRGDGPNFPVRYEPPLHRGVEARLLYRRGDWLQVELSGGEVGWVAQAETVS
jgi:hypothetical protein